jgi:MFS family permease
VTLRRDLRACFWDGVIYSVMVGIGETYLPAFVLALGYGAVAAGLITTIPLAAGAVLQLISPAGVRRLGSHRRWVVLCAAAQAAGFLPLAVGSLRGSMPLWAVYLSATVYWGAGLATGAAWNTWIETLVPRVLRAHYFARRTRFSQVGVLTGFVIGGATLFFAAKSQSTLFAFGGLFTVACVCRCISAWCLACQTEPVPPSPDDRRIGLGELWSRARHSGDGRLLIYLFAVQTAAQLAGPYFTPYMLGPLGLDYAGYVFLMAVAFAAKAVALPIFGSMAHRRGAHQLLWMAGIAIVPIASFWLISQNFYFLICVQISAGFAWAAYELAMFLMFFEAIPRRERTSLLTIYNLGNSLAIGAGSLLGGALLSWGGKSAQAYLLLFGLSSIGRAFALFALARVPFVQIAAQSVATRSIGVSAGDSAFEQPILPSLEDKR